jgi:hypothetical protein
MRIWFLPAPPSGARSRKLLRRGRDLSEFGRLMEDLPLLIRRADLRRIELKVELLSRRLKEADAEHGRAVEAASRTLASLEEAEKSYVRAASVERRLSLEAQRVRGLRDQEAGRLKWLRAEERMLQEKVQEKARP